MRDPHSGAWSPLEVLAAASLAGAVIVCAGAWALGAAAGAVSGHGVPHVGLGDMPGVLGRLPRHLADPARAWPARVRDGLPGAGGFALALALLVGLIALAARGVLAARRLLSAAPEAARWGHGRELDALRVRRGEGGRLVLGRQGSALLAAEPRQSVIVVAPTQTGKTTGLAVPAILEWDGPVLATSVKTDLVADTIDCRKRCGEVKVFDPTAVTGHEAAHWTPLAGCLEWQGARETASQLCSVARPGSGLTDSDYWTTASARYLAPLLYAAANSGLEMADVVRWVDGGGEDELRGILAGLQYEDEDRPAQHVASTAALKALQSVWDADDRLRSSITSTVGVVLDAYGDPEVASTGRLPEITPEWLLSGNHSAYLCATATGQERLRPLFVTLIDQLVSEVYERAARSGGPIDPSLLIVLDEAANIAPLPRLDQLAATGAGQGIQLVTVVQDLAQVEARWRGAASTIVNNHRAKLFGSGISCEKTLLFLTRVLGDQAIKQRSYTLGENGRKTTTDATTYRALGPADRLRQGEPGSAVLIYGNLPPARVAFRPWYRDRHLRRLKEASR